MSKNVGIFSGTFDPIHDGHLLFAEAAKQAVALDEVLLLVQKKPWGKQPDSSYEDRMRMAQIATELTGVIRVLEDEELDVGDAHTTKETMQALRGHYPDDTTFTLLLGGDAFEKIEQWDGYKQLANEVSFVVGLRTEDDGEIVTPLAKKIGADARIIVSPMPLVSSTSIRSALAKSKTMPKGLDDDVYEYITNADLYSK